MGTHIREAEGNTSLQVPHTSPLTNCWPERNTRCADKMENTPLATHHTANTECVCEHKATARVCSVPKHGGDTGTTNSGPMSHTAQGSRQHLATQETHPWVTQTNTNKGVHSTRMSVSTSQTLYATGYTNRTACAHRTEGMPRSV